MEAMMTIPYFDIEMALLSALVNGDMRNLTTDITLDDALGQRMENFISSVSFVIGNKNYYGVLGWKPVSVSFSKIQEMAPAVTGYEQTFGFDGMSGLAAATFVKGNEAVISFRGTEPAWNDRWADGLLGLGVVPEQVYAAYYYTKAALASLPFGVTKISFTGHSLGGGLASIMAHYFGYDAVVFDSAPNSYVAEALKLGAGTGTVHWPAIPMSTSIPGHVRLYQSELCPVSSGAGNSGGGRLGDASDPNPDIHVFDLAADASYFSHTTSAAQFLLDTGIKSFDLHSINLVTLQMLLDEGQSGAEHANSLGAITAKLPDLMTYLTAGGTGNEFSDVNLVHDLGDHYGMTDADGEHRYDLFLRALVEDKLFRPTAPLVTTWLSDLNNIADNTGSVARHTPGTEDDTRDWLAQQALVMAAISNTAYQAATTMSIGAPAITVQGGVTYAGLSRLAEANDGQPLGAERALANLLSLNAYNATARAIYPQVWGFRYPNLEIPSSVRANLKTYFGDKLLENRIQQIVVGANATGADTLTGTAGNDFLYGRKGDDLMAGGAGGVDWFNGGDGRDTADFSASTSGLKVDITEKIGRAHV